MDGFCDPVLFLVLVWFRFSGLTGSTTGSVLVTLVGTLEAGAFEVGLWSQVGHHMRVRV